ncbi:hypothetical protein C9374_014179 [Naegleria lovaniensis]|uniref:Uncharacterized protein n=1 Tax=Naegleria lovaniensis TaxID=51637 RepID=A0AA88KPX9_NAELO|nr:uncharacterized protein C9374_014179 [Naegleria lovaniensis]KAG2389619.1 hypothetical protein C9374_014179 [Naegleria lovaniensis]
MISSPSYQFRCLGQPEIQPFHQTFVFVEGSWNDDPHNGQKESQNFLIYEISNLQHIQCKEVFRVDDLSQLSDKNRKEARLSEVKLDWELAWLLNQKNNSSVVELNSVNSSSSNLEKKDDARKIRAVGLVGCLISSHCTCNEHAMITNWTLQGEMSQHVEKYRNRSNNNAVGFVNGRALFMSSLGVNTLPDLEKILDDRDESIAIDKEGDDCSTTSLVLEPVQIFTQNNSAAATTQFRDCTNIMMVLPSSNIAHREYSFSGIYFGGSVYRYSLKEDGFVTSHPSIPLVDETLSKNFSFSRGSFGRYPRFIPLIENGQRLRSFFFQEGKLYEFVWSDAECSSLKVVQHLEWLNNDFDSVTRIGNVGLLLGSNQSTIFFRPQEKICNDEPFSKAKGKISVLNRKLNGDVFWCEESECVAQFNNQSPQMFEKVLSLQDLLQLEFKLVSELFDEESALKDLEFSCYVPRVQNSKLLEIVNPSKLHRQQPRISIAYQCAENRYNDMEIIAGIGCKECQDKLGDIISESYVELEPKDFASYLGAPIMHTTSWFADRLEYRYFILDMKDGKQSSGVINVASINGGCSSTTTIDLNELVKKRDTNVMTDETCDTFSKKNSKTFIGILSPKSQITQIGENTGGVIVQNVKPGLWKWAQYGCDSKEYSGTGNVAQLVAVHGDYKHLLQDPKIWIVPEGTYGHTLDRSRKIEKTEFHEQELEGGWYVMKLGVGVDVAMAGIYDQQYFNDASTLELEKKQKPSALDLNFKFSFQSEWQEYVSKVMEQRGYPSSIPVPYGIISSSGYGDGCYACLFKKSEDHVVAVKLVFVNETSHSDDDE